MGHASAHNTEMWMPWRLWAMLVQLLVEPWSAGYHQPYHNSPKLRKIPQPEGKRLHFWTIQRRLWNCANRQSRGNVLNHTCRRSNTPLYKSLIREKTKQRRTWKAETEQVRKPSAITPRVDRTPFTLAAHSSHRDSPHSHPVFSYMIRNKDLLRTWLKWWGWGSTKGEKGKCDGKKGEAEKGCKRERGGDGGGLSHLNGKEGGEEKIGEELCAGRLNPVWLSQSQCAEINRQPEREWYKEDKNDTGTVEGRMTAWILL